VLGAKKPFQPETRARDVPMGGDGNPVWTFRDLLPDLARTYGVQVIADAYWQAGWYLDPRSVASAEPIALFELLDRLVGSSHRWDRVRDLIRLRSRTWFLDRPREIPLRLIRRWKASCDDKGALSLEEYVEIACSLTDTQLLSLNLVRRDTGLPDEVESAATMRHALRLYGALHPAQRATLWRGAALPVAQMTPLQRELFAASLCETRVARAVSSFREAAQREPFDGSRRAPWQRRFELITGEPLATGSLSLTAQPLLRTTVKRGGVIVRRTTGPLPAAGGAESPAPAGSAAGAIAVAPPAGTREVGSAPAAPRDGARGSHPDTLPEEVIRQPVTNGSFVFHHGSETPDSVHLTVARVAR
jgi:hypothetical protein